MRPLARLLLLAMGCAVMLATTLARPYPSTFITHPVQLPGGGAELLEIFMQGEPGKRFTTNTYVRTWSRSGRLVGVLSPTAPPAEALSALSPSASYVVGEQLGALGTVAFVLYAPQEQVFDDRESRQPSLLPEPGTAFLTPLLRRPASNTVDPTDLIALVMLGVAVWDARRLMQSGKARCKAA